ncbi:c-type cytochrome [Thiocystis violascens]|uniref:Cytochrome c553 n=1 Tax=Thiocystis violascens (strain ATCC 17096 / DSM 198 / 6111) TaxID=765911 RepID=I3YEE2_THIV6|nr:c-type cytochrome [Thiocystis violascens]AFL75360.1 cytochrome c553 [Thiocystis violascens DSM 198]
MNRFMILALSLIGASAWADAPTPPIVDPPRQPYAPGIESPGYIWNDLKGEELLALRAQGNAEHGEAAFIVCVGCHGSDAPGDEAGFYPRLAGQHASVLIKQLADVREGRRDNPKMYPYANEHVISTQEMADIAVYLHRLPVPEDHGQGTGETLSVGAELYRKDCKSCHGSSGEGSDQKFYPRLNGQHYKYLLRQAYDIRDGVRRNANPEMVDAIKPYSDAEVDAVTDYISRMAVKTEVSSGTP